MNLVKILKYILYIINSLFLLFGILLIAAGSIFFSEFAKMNSLPITALSWGCLMFVIAFLGGYGTIKENTYCIIPYSVIMLISFIVRISLAIYIWMHHSQLVEEMENGITGIWNEIHAHQKEIDHIQLVFNCCGKNAYTDYPLAGENIPLSCCGADAKKCSEVNAKARPGCASTTAKHLELSIDVARYGELVISFVELFASICGGFLAIQLRNSYPSADY